MADDRSAFRRYLLGELEETELEAFERKLLVSDEHFEELGVAEDELIDDYWAGSLGGSDARKYREHFLNTPERRVKHRFGEALREHIAAAAAAAGGAPPQPVEREPFLRMWLRVAAAAAMVGFALWFIVTPPAPLRLEQTAPHEEGAAVAFFLAAGNLRSLPSEPERILTVPGGVAYVDLQVGLPDRAGDVHDAVVENARTGRALAEGRLLSQTIEGQRVVVASVPSPLLTPGDYRVILRAPSNEGERAAERAYAFRVVRP